MKCVTVGDNREIGRHGSIVAHAVVEYIRTQYEFPFDVMDLEENLDEVLHYFGVFLELADFEKSLVIDGLRKLAEGFELAEVERLVFGFSPDRS